jgi:hypothetical protein
VRNVNTSGALNNNNAYNGNYGVRPLWWISPTEYAPERTAENSTPPQRRVHPHLIIEVEYKIADANALFSMRELLNGKEVLDDGIREDLQL